MSYGPQQVFYAGIASGASTSSSIDLGGKSYTKLAVNFVTMSTGAEVTVYGAASESATYYAIHERVNTATMQYQHLKVTTGTSAGWALIDAPPMQYLKFITSAVVSGGVSFTVLAYD